MPMQRNIDDYMNMIKDANTASSGGTRSYKVENAFTPTEKDGKYSVVMRFLPSHPSEFRPWVENQQHFFKLKNGSWFGCDCLSKFNETCPICKYNGMMWKKYGRDEGKNHVLGRAKPKYVTNVLIVRNPNAPDTEGKVYRFEFGPLIFKMLSEAVTDHEDLGVGTVKGFNPFHWTEGANFVYEGIRNGQYIKNDTSHFSPVGPINKWNGSTYVNLTEAEIADVESRLYTLDECEKKLDKCLTYDEILKRYKDKTGEDLFENEPSGLTNTKAAAPSLDAPVPPVSTPRPAPAPMPSFESSMPSTNDETTSSDIDDYFNTL